MINIYFFQLLFFISLSIDTIAYASYEKGRSLFINSCVACHSATSEIAPNVYQISEAYKLKLPNSEERIKSYKMFLSHQNEKDILMPQAVAKYGAMPKMSVSSKDIESLSLYLTQSDFKDLDKVSSVFEETAEEKGARIVSTTKSDIGKNLMMAIKDKKTMGAIAFCKEQAIPITSKHAEHMKAVIKRATDKTRNPKNLADHEEQKYIDHFKQELSNGVAPKPVLVSKEGEYRYYSPIITNAQCLQCHGKQNVDVQNDVWKKIKDLYPLDMATGYSANEVRGVFSVRWKK